MFVVLLNRSLKPDSSPFALSDVSDDEFDASTQGEVFYLMFRRRVMRIASFTKGVQL